MPTGYCGEVNKLTFNFNKDIGVSDGDGSERNVKVYAGSYDIEYDAKYNGFVSFYNGTDTSPGIITNGSEFTAQFKNSDASDPKVVNYSCECGLFDSSGSVPPTKLSSVITSAYTVEVGEGRDVINCEQRPLVWSSLKSFHTGYFKDITVNDRRPYTPVAIIRVDKTAKFALNLSHTKNGVNDPSSSFRATGAFLYNHTDNTFKTLPPTTIGASTTYPKGIYVLYAGAAANSGDFVIDTDTYVTTFALGASQDGGVEVVTNIATTYAGLRYTSASSIFDTLPSGRITPETTYVGTKYNGFNTLLSVSPRTDLVVSKGNPTNGGETRCGSIGSPTTNIDLICNKITAATLALSIDEIRVNLSMTGGGRTNGSVPVSFYLNTTNSNTCAGTPTARKHLKIDPTNFTMYGTMMVYGGSTLTQPTKVAPESLYGGLATSISTSGIRDYITCPG